MKLKRLIRFIATLSFIVWFPTVAVVLLDSYYRSKTEENPEKFQIETENIVLPILVFSCNRPDVQRCLEGLLKYRSDPQKFPIIVSQDCRDDITAQTIKAFLPQVTYIQV